MSANVTQDRSSRTTSVVDWEPPTPSTDLIFEMSYSQFSLAGVVEQFNLTVTELYNYPFEILLGLTQNTR